MYAKSIEWTEQKSRCRNGAMENGKLPPNRGNVNDQVWHQAQVFFHRSNIRKGWIYFERSQSFGNGKKNLRIMKVEEALLFVLFLGRKGVRMYHVANTVVGFEVGRI
jgi:hypothetical protein